STSSPLAPTISSRPGRTTRTASPCCGRSPWPFNSTNIVRNAPPCSGRRRPTTSRSGSAKPASTADDRLFASARSPDEEAPHRHPALNPRTWFVVVEPGLTSIYHTGYSFHYVG